MDTSIRSYLAAGVAAATASVIVAMPIQPAPAITRAAHAFALTAAVQPLIAPLQTAAVAIGTGTANAQPTAATTAAATAAATALPTAPDWAPPATVGESLGNAIINIYNALEPWVQWGFEVVAWAASWVVGALADQINIVYDSIEPAVAGVVYSVAYLLDGDFSLILPTLVTGVQTGVQNLIYGEIAWVLSFFPPLPPIGSVFSAAPPAAALATAETTPSVTDEQADANSATSPIITKRSAAASTPTESALPERAAAQSALAAAVAEDEMAPGTTAGDDTDAPAATPDANAAPDLDAASTTATKERATKTPHRAASGTGKSAAKTARTDRSETSGKRH